MAPYQSVIASVSKKTYKVYINLFKSVGFDERDLININNVHLTSFLGLYSMETMPHKYIDFLEAHESKFHKSAGSEDVIDKNKANLTIFLKQRMEDLVRICRQKARNIKGVQIDEFSVFYGPTKPPKILRLLLEDHQAFGFKKLDMGSFKSIKKRMQIKDQTIPFEFAGNWYVAVPLPKRELSIVDFCGADLDPYDSIHNKDPEQLILEQEKENWFERNREIFLSFSKEEKALVFKNFIKEERKNPKFQEEVGLARKMLKEMGL